jgi:hypothetical protein
MAIDPVYLCKDCKFSKMSIANTIFTFGGRMGAEGFMYKCTRSRKTAYDIIDPVTGPARIKATLGYCDVERKHGDCGPTAKNWAAKYKKDLFKMLTKETHD